MTAAVGAIAFGVAYAGGSTRLTASLVCILLAAAGGAFLPLGFHLRGRLLPVPVALLHGTIAATGFVLLLAWLLA